MFTRIHLENYKSLVNFDVNLEKSKTQTRHLMYIYGENGSGKTNFIDSFFTLNDFFTTKSHKEIFEKAERLKKFISIDMADGDAQTDAMEQLIETYPDLRIAIGHFGMVTTDGWEKQIALAKHEHVYIESGGITWLFHKEFYPYPSAVRAIRTAIDICGIDKLMWGSDYPRTMTAITYDMSKDFIEKTTELSEEEKIKFLGENARAFYGFEELEVPEKIRNMVE